jgi:inosose dehydratase
VIPLDRIGGAPITWGVCEVPGWGVMLSADRVLGEMRSLGITATELGAPGFLPEDPEALSEALLRNGMRLIGGFVPVVLHDADERATMFAGAARTAKLFADLGATMFVTAVVVDAGWAPRFELSAAQWGHVVGMLAELDSLCAEHGLTQALHPHVGTLVETAADVELVLARSAVRWCLDTGHLLIGGYDPARFAADAAGRIVHVHLKDVRSDVAARVLGGQLSIRDGVGEGLFCPLGDGDAPILDTVEALEASGYRGWYVLEQDTDLGATEPPPGTGPVEAARASLDFLRAPASR